MGIKILTTVIKQKYKIWIGRTELQLWDLIIIFYSCESFKISVQ
jgi:hypothetical protein